MKYAVVRQGVVVNVIEWDGDSLWTAPPGTVIVQSEQAAIGDTLNSDGVTFTPAPAPDE